MVTRLAYWVIYRLEHRLGLSWDKLGYLGLFFLIPIRPIYGIPALPDTNTT